ncbi:MAG: ribonucleoside triphosphate reductase, partial [Elusimicrobiales bacterium]|nr:ribonucleoside triphosphate reductase [Elusimicrobiales bacterium]
MTSSKINQVEKRDGTRVAFDQSHITNAIFKALTASDEGNGDKSQKLSDKVTQILSRRFKKEEVPTVEQIQDIVEEVLILEDFVETAKSYILYRDQRRKIRESVKVYDEASEIYDKYIDELDWQVRENANMAYSLQGLNHYGVSVLTKKYWLNKVYPREIREGVKSGDFHLHN